jgi:hypothetical protein
MPLVVCQYCTCFKAKTAEAYKGCLETCSKMKNKCPPQQKAPAPTDQTGLGKTDQSDDALAGLRAARDNAQARLQEENPNAAVRVRVILEVAPDLPDFPLMGSG